MRGDMDSGKKYEFKKLKNSSDKFLICPKCFELLFRDDFEHFSCCPYCNSPIEISAEMEDYLLKPVVDNWISSQNRAFPGTFPSEI